MNDLLEKLLRVSKITAFNDPFECHFVIPEPTESQLEAAYRRALQQYPRALNRAIFEEKIRSESYAQREGLRAYWEERFRTLCCVNLDPTIIGPMQDILMWSHYAEKHQGIRIHFSDQFANDPALDFERMDYEDSLLEFTVDIFFQPDHELDILDFLPRCLRRKSKVWEWENEWRAHIPLPNIAETRIDRITKISTDYIHLRCSDVIRIDFGIESSPSNEEISHLRSTFDGVELFKATKCDKSFSCRYQLIP